MKFENEKAIDCGGVARDMFSGCCEEATKKAFNGCNLLVPMIRPEIDVQVFLFMGRLLCHDFLACNYLPVATGFPVY